MTDWSKFPEGYDIEGAKRFVESWRIVGPMLEAERAHIAMGKPYAWEMATDQSFGVIPVDASDSESPRFLLVKHHAGHWAFPKGHPEKGETDQDAARRELLEETGLTVGELVVDPSAASDPSLFGTGATPRPAKLEERYTFTDRKGRLIDKTVVFFVGLVEATDAKPQEAEIAELAWLTLDEALERMTFDEGKRVLREAAGLVGR